MLILRRILSLILVAAHVSAQQQQQNLLLNNLNTLTTSSSSANAATAFTFERANEQTTYYVSLSLCTDITPYPQFYMANGSNSNITLDLSAGFATWNGTSPGGVLIYALPVAPIGGNQTEWSFQLAVSTTSFFHKLLDEAPRIGDTTSSIALLFSPAFLFVDDLQPVYPNYTLPAPDLPLPSPPPTPPNSTLVFFLGSTPQNGLFRSACALKQTPSLIPARNSSLVFRDLGWKSQHIVEGLNSGQSYTAYTITEDRAGVTLSQPATVITKSAGYTCPLVHSLPFCPQVAWSTPLPPPGGGSTTYTASNLPSSLHDALVGSMGNFTRSLSTFACGRDLYSVIQSCADCERAYRTWLCEMFLPRCGEAPVASLNLSTLNLPAPALLSRTANPFGSFGVNGGPSTWTELLPCLEVCHLVDRACPPMLQWRCPTAKVNANRTYGVGFIDAWDGQQDNGFPGHPQDDKTGVAFCNWGR